jgi:multicomponent K+:H+ antiporter subunit G
MNVLAAALVLAGSLLAFVGALGLLRMPTFFERVHPPTMGTTLGAWLIIGGSLLYAGLVEGRPVLHEAAIGLFLMITTPVTYLLLGRAALARGDVAPASPPAGSS